METGHSLEALAYPPSFSSNVEKQEESQSPSDILVLKSHEDPSLQELENEEELIIHNISAFKTRRKGKRLLRKGQNVASLIFLQHTTLKFRCSFFLFSETGSSCPKFTIAEAKCYIIQMITTEDENVE